MNDLLRDLAPIAERAWELIEEEATRALKHFLAGRQLVDFEGPSGWVTSAVATGRVEAIESPGAPVEARLRDVRPLVELRTPFTLDRHELEAAARGAEDPELQPVVDAARQAAKTEDQTVFHGYAAAGIEGIAESSPHDPLPISEDYQRYPGTVAHAVADLRRAGVTGPYAVALGPRCYTGLVEATNDVGFPIIETVRSVVDGPMVWAPALDGGLVISLRGGDYELRCGRDFSIGYLDHDADQVQLYLEESIMFRSLGPEAAVHLAYAD